MGGEVAERDGPSRHVNILTRGLAYQIADLLESTGTRRGTDAGRFEIT